MASTSKTIKERGMMTHSRRLSPCPICLPSLPGQYGLGADARFCGRHSNQWIAIPCGRGKPHQPPCLSGQVCWPSSACLLCRLVKRSRPERPDGRLLAFAPDHVALRLSPYLLHYRAAFAFSILLYPPSYRPSLRVAFPFGRTMGFPRSASVP